MPFTRALYVTGVCLTIGTGIGLFGVPDRTQDYWAWVVKAPLSAAFFGAGYIGAAVSLALAARAREWRQTRVVAVVALTLTSLALLGTLLEPQPFAFGEGGLTEAVAWIWLGVYVVLPPAALTAFVLQERAGGAREYGSDTPALASTRMVLGALGAGLVAVGIGLFAEWSWLLARWPWPLPPLPAEIVGAWLCTYGAGLLWFALRERDWRRGRIAVVPGVLTVVLDLVSAARYWDDLDGGAATSVYLAVLGTLLVALIGATLVEDRRLRTAAPASTAPASV
jgi:hypothetical protein